MLKPCISLDDNFIFNLMKILHVLVNQTDLSLIDINGEIIKILILHFFNDAKEKFIPHLDRIADYLGVHLFPIWNFQIR